MGGNLKGLKPKGFGKIAAPPQSGPDPNTVRVVFGFRHVVKGYDLSGGNGKHASSFIDGLRLRCSMTWAEIRSQNRERLGAEKIAKAMKVGVPPSIPTNSVSELLCFRFGGEVERFIGFRDGAVFEVVWIDHSGECYDH